MDGSRIRALRKERGMKVEELAVAAGVSPGHLYKLEGGKFKNPGLELLERIADALDAEVPDLFSPKPKPLKAVR